jgi:hypothetical protein
MVGLQSERKAVVVAAPAENPILAIAKDWLAGGTAAGVSKTLVAPIGTLPPIYPVDLRCSSVSHSVARKPPTRFVCKVKGRLC